MKEKTEKIDRIIQKHTEEVKNFGSELFYDFFVNPPEISMELMVGPLEVGEGVTHLLAEKIAEKFGVKLTKYDFSGDRWSEPREYKTVFSVTVPDDEGKFENAVERLCVALREFREASNRMIKTLGY